MSTSISLGEKLKAIMAAKPAPVAKSQARCECCGSIRLLSDIQQYQKPDAGEKYWQCFECLPSDDLEEKQHYFQRWLNK